MVVETAVQSEEQDANGCPEKEKLVYDTCYVVVDHNLFFYSPLSRQGEMGRGLVEGVLVRDGKTGGIEWSVLTAAIST